MGTSTGIEEADLFFRPTDPMAKSIPSKSVSTGNVLVQITVPRRTGRKRKRDSQEPFQYHNLPEQSEGQGPFLKIGDAKKLLRTLKDNPERYTIQGLGHVDQTHRFRAMHDLVYSTASIPFVQRVTKELISMDYDSIRKFKFDSNAHETTPGGDLIPPVLFTHHHIPFNYAYNQNPSVIQVDTPAGNKRTFNPQLARRSKLVRLSFDAKEVPEGPSPEIPTLDLLDDKMRDYVQKARNLFEERPIWTRRALFNMIPDPQWDSIAKMVLPHVAYEFRSGPWRDSLVRFGVDPRKDPKYRVYQTLMFQFDTAVGLKKTAVTGGRRVQASGPRVPKEEIKARDDGGLGVRSHIFDGTRFGQDGKVWQVCDITDKTLKRILGTSELRRRCHVCSTTHMCGLY